MTAVVQREQSTTMASMGGFGNDIIVSHRIHRGSQTGAAAAAAAHAAHGQQPRPQRPPPGSLMPSASPLPGSLMPSARAPVPPLGRAGLGQSGRAESADMEDVFEERNAEEAQPPPLPHHLFSSNNNNNNNGSGGGSRGPTGDQYGR